MNFATWEWEVIVGFVVVLGFLWRLSHTLNRDMGELKEELTKQVFSLGERVSNLAERVAKIEGALFYRLDLPKKKKKE